MVDGLKLQSIADMIADLEDEQLTTFEAFVGWCKRAGIDTAAVDGSSSASEGGGLVAARAIGADDTILAVPLDVSLEVDVKRPHLAPHAALLAALEPTHALALAVCLSTAADADLAPWLALWPQTAVGAWGWRAAEWEAVAWCDEAAELHVPLRGAAQAAYDDKIAPHFAERDSACPTWDRFEWALSMVSSRAAANVLSGDDRLAIVPMVDMMNHRVTPSAYLSYDAAARAIVVKAYVALEAGAAVSICYGEKENAELLASYGFALARNPADTASVRVEVAADHPLAADAGGSLRSFLPQGLGAILANGGRCVGAVRWDPDWADAYDDRPVDVDDALVLRPDVHSGELPLVAALSLATTDTAVIGALGALAAGGAALGAREDVREAMGAALRAALAKLPSEQPAVDVGDAPGNLAAFAVALEARRALLRAAADAQTAADAA